MRVLKGTLTFVLGIIMGIVLFVGAIAGTIYAVATSFTIGDITEKVGLTGEKAIFDEGSEITNKTIWEVGQDLIADVQNIGNMSLNEIAEKYGLTKHTDNFGEISGIDISPLFDVPINQLKDNLGVIVDNITLNDIGEFAGMDFTEYGLPILEDNLYSPVTKALDAILKSIDGDNITLRQIEDNFGITLGENAIFNQIKDTPLSTFGDVINGIEVGKIIDADCDKFVKLGENQIYVKVDRYEEVMGDEIDLVKDGAATYVYGRSGDENLVRELRFVKKTTTDEEGNTIDVVDEHGNLVYKVDNTCYTATEDNDKVYYRFIEFEAYDPDTMPATSEFYVRAYGNHFVEIGGEYVPTTDGYVLLSSFAKNEGGSPFTTDEGKVTVTGNVYVYDDTLGAFVIAPTFGLNPEYTPATKDSRLDEGFDGYVRVHTGSSDVAIQVIAYTTVSGLNNATDTLMSLKLGDLIEVTEDSATILQTLKDKPLNKLSDSIDDLILGDVIEITYSLYAEDEKGDYVKIEDGDNFYYTLYNPDLHSGATRYTKLASGDPNHPDYILATEAEIANSSIQKFYLDEATDTMVSGTPAGENLYVIGSASSKILQRLASISIGDFSDAFNDLVLGDVIDVDMDVYEPLPSTFDFTSVSPFDEFFVFDGSMYLTTDTPETDITTKTVYRLVEESDTSAILKKLALVKVNDLSDKMNTLIDDMRLDEVMDIEPVLYLESADGSYVYIKDGGYFTLYNPAVHTDSTRYVRVTNDDDTYRLATEDEIADTGITKYYWNSTEKRMETTGSGDAYVVTIHSSLMLQRFARVKISGFSNALDGLALSDVMDIDADVYKEVENTIDTTKTYYRYDNGLYVEAPRDYIDEHPISEENRYFVVDSYGTSHVVMKKMAYLPVTDLGNRMEDVISDLYLKDLMDIYEFDVIKESDASDESWFIPYDDDYTEFVEKGGGEIDTYNYAFILDKNGKYYLRDTMHFALNEAQTAALETGSVTYKYSLFDASLIPVPDPDKFDEFTEFITDLFKSGGHGYYKDKAGKMHYNPALCTYIVLSGRSDLYSRLYTREKAESGYTGETLILPIYRNPTYNDGKKMLYVKVLGNYVEYDATNPVHADLEKYLLLRYGYALVEDSTADTRKRTRFYLTNSGITTSNTDAIDGFLFIQNTSKGQSYMLDESTDTYYLADCYYYSPLDSEYQDLLNNYESKSFSKPATFSKQIASTIYIEIDDEASATLAFYDKKIIATDELPDDATAPKYVEAIVGVLCNKAGIYAGSTKWFANAFSIEYIQQQSAPALKAFAVHDVKVSNLNDKLEEFKIRDMMDVAPDSLFDDEDIKNASIDDLGTVFQKKLKNMTIQNILDWGNITTLSDEVLSIIGEATLEDFFASLSYANGDIHVDIITLYDNIYTPKNVDD